MLNVLNVSNNLKKIMGPNTGLVTKGLAQKVRKTRYKLILEKN